MGTFQNPLDASRPIPTLSPSQNPHFSTRNGSKPHPPVSPRESTTRSLSTNCSMASPAAGTAPFLTKTYAIVDDPETDDIISWNDSGTTFVVWRRSDFERDLLPKNFKHSNFASFVRQLNTYGFKKVGVDRWEFANECFRKGEKHLLGGIQRRKGSGGAGAPASAVIPTAIALPISPTATSSGGDPPVSSSSPPRPGSGSAVSGAVAELEEEISRLRRENARLSRELARARRAFDDVRRVVTRYDHGGDEEDERPGAAGGGGKPMLFGVAIGSKRSREVDGDEEDGAEEDGGDEDEEEEDYDDERHAARRDKARRTELSDLNVLALSVRAAAAARAPDVGSRGTKNHSVSLPLGSNRATL